MASSLKPRVRLLAHSAMSLCLAIGVLLTTLTFTHITHGSSPQPMSCCVGESAGHCSSGMVAPLPPPPEPMCGLEELAEDAYETVVPEPNDSTEQPATSVESYPSLNTPCPTDCCALVWSGLKRPRRDFADLIHRRVVVEDLVLFARFQKLETHSLASARFNRSIPRGPPA